MLKLHKQKILVTGSSGFVGSHLVRRLEKDNEIVEYDLKSKQDILNERFLLKKLRGVDLVIHLAAFISAQESWEKPKEYFENNAIGTLSVVRNSIKAKVPKLIYFSSAAVKALPLTPYAISKKAGEEIINLYSKDIDFIIVRPENIYGPGQKESYGYVIHNFIKAIKNNDPIQIYGEGLQSRDFIYIDDVVSTVERLINKKFKGQIVSLGTGVETSIKNLALMIQKELNNKSTISYEPAREEPKKSVANTNSLMKMGINTSKFINLKKGIGKLIQQV